MHFIPLFRSLVDETKTKLLKYVGKWSSFRFWDAFVSSLAALAPAAHTLSKTKLAEATSSPACIFHIMQAHSAWPILVWRKHQEQKKSKWLQRKYDREGHGISLLIEEEQIMSFPCVSHGGKHEHLWKDKSQGVAWRRKKIIHWPLFFCTSFTKLPACQKWSLVFPKIPCKINDEVDIITCQLFRTIVLTVF